MFNQIKMLLSIIPILFLFLNDCKASQINNWFKFKHHNNFELNQILQTVVSKCPQIATIYELSERSVLGWPLTVIEFSNKPGQHQLCKLFNSIVLVFLLL